MNKKDSLYKQMLSDLKGLRKVFENTPTYAHGQLYLTYSGVGVEHFDWVCDLIAQTLKFEHFKYNFEIMPGVNVKLLLN